MNDINGTTDETDDYLGTTTDGYHDTSAHAYQMGLDQDLTTDEYWLHYNTTDVYHSGENVTTEYPKTTDEIVYISCFSFQNAFWPCLFWQETVSLS